MTSRNIFPVILLIASMLFVGCSNDAPASEASQPAPAATTPTPAPAPAPPSDGLQVDTVVKSVETLSESPTTGSDTKPNKKKAKPNLPPSVAAAQKQNPAGKPTGYIGRANIVFYSEPSTTAQKLSTLKVNESVIILETKMTDEAGKSFDMPQWYKVQLTTNKKVGWVIGSSITIN